MVFVMPSGSRDPGTEAHGGYTFCGFAALVLLGKPHLCDVNKLLVSKSPLACCDGSFNQIHACFSKFLN